MADKKVFEAASITSLDFDRTEVDSNSGSGAGSVPSTPIIPIGPSAPYDHYDLYFSDLDTGSYSTIRLVLYGFKCKEYKNVSLEIQFKPGACNDTFKDAFEPGKGGTVNPYIPTGSGNTVKADFTVNCNNNTDTLEIWFKTTWEHAIAVTDATVVANGNAKIGGYNGYRAETIGLTRNIAAFANYISIKCTP